MSNTLDLTKENIQQVVDASMEHVVVLVFWSSQQGESVTFMQTMEQLAAKQSGRFILAKVNYDSEMEIANYFRIQSLPTTLVLTQGQPVDGFAGVHDELAINAMLDKHLPLQWQIDFNDAKALLAQSDRSDADLASALATLKQVYADNPLGEVALALADAALLSDDISLAETVLAKVGLADQDGYYQNLKAKLALAKDAADTPEIRELQQKWMQDSTNLVVLVELAKAMHQARRDEEALSLLFEVLAKDLSADDGKVKQAFMDVLTAIGQGNSLANQYRRKLYTLLY